MSQEEQEQQEEPQTNFRRKFSFGPKIFSNPKFFWTKHFFHQTLDQKFFRPEIFFRCKFFLGAKFFLKPKFFQTQIFSDPKFDLTQNFNENDLWRDKTELLPSAKVLLKLEFDTEDQVLFLLKSCLCLLNSSKVLNNQRTFFLEEKMNPCIPHHPYNRKYYSSHPLLAIHTEDGGNRSFSVEGCEPVPLSH